MIVYLIQTNAFGSKILKYASTFFSVAVCTEKKKTITPKKHRNLAPGHCRLFAVRKTIAL